MTSDHLCMCAREPSFALLSRGRCLSVVHAVMYEDIMAWDTWKWDRALHFPAILLALAQFPIASFGQWDLVERACEGRTSSKNLGCVAQRPPPLGKHPEAPTPWETLSIIALHVLNEHWRRSLSSPHRHVGRIETTEQKDISTKEHSSGAHKCFYRFTSKTHLQ